MVRRVALTLLLVTALALAGCGGGAGDGATPTATGEANRLGADAAAAMRAADTYAVAANVTRTQRANGRAVTTRVNSTGVVDRTARALYIDQTARSAAGATRVETYLLNGTLYQHSAAFESRYGSAWVRTDLDENATAVWARQDPLSRQRALLANATVRLVGTASVGGTETRVLAVDGNESAYEDLLRARLGRLGGEASLTVENISFRMHAAADSGRLLRSSGTVESTVTYGGTTASIEENLTLRFSAYGDPVNVTLPEGAETAVTPTTSG